MAQQYEGRDLHDHDQAHAGRRIESHLIAVLLVGRLQPVLTFGREVGKRCHEWSGIATRHRPETGWVEKGFEHQPRFIQAMVG
jgi:hypothetical protein